MKLRFAKHLFGGALALAAMTSSSAVGAAEPGVPYIVSSEVVSDTVVGNSNYVGDLDSGTVIGDYQESGCQDGSCQDGSCQGGACAGGNCAGGICGAGGLRHGRLGHGHAALFGNGLDGAVAGIHGIGGANAGCQPRKYDHSDLFYNYYTQGNCNRANAQMYISPLPVPHFVGHTYFTYQPFYPEEYLYWHKNRFHNSYDNGRGMNRTRAVYYAPPVKTFVSNLYWNKLRIPR
ncbi:hypothetical protein [Roseiconus nitratireducens]|uniref:hypothetical protein n=1 Tax=Roseiconus nitratireducens TaxID=2605748 RepID=UPI001F386261|nr:hypothetical protein [Roseiconus nitratireducens]